VRGLKSLGTAALQYGSKLKIYCNLSGHVSHTHIYDDGGGLCRAAEALRQGEEDQWPAAGSVHLNQKKYFHLMAIKG